MKATFPLVQCVEICVLAKKGISKGFEDKQVLEVRVVRNVASNSQLFAKQLKQIEEGVTTRVQNGCNVWYRGRPPSWKIN